MGQPASITMIRLRAVLLAWFAAGCGRLDFDPRGARSDAKQLDASATSDASSVVTPDAAGDAPAMATPAMVQSSVVSVDSNGITLSLPAPSTPGTLLVATIAGGSVNPIGLPPAWVTAGWIGHSGDCYVTLAYLADNPGNVTSATFSQGAGVPIVGQMTEWSGVATSSPLDGTGMVYSGSQVTSQSVQTSGMTTTAGELGVDVFCEYGNNPTYTAGSWTSLGSYSNVSNSPSFMTDFQRGLAPGLVGDTVTTNLSSKYSAVVATFRPQ